MSQDIEAQQPLIGDDAACCKVIIKEPPTVTCAATTCIILLCYGILLALLLQCYRPVCLLFFFSATLAVVASMGCIAALLFICVSLFDCDTYVAYPLVSTAVIIAFATFPLLYFYLVVMG